MLSLGLAIRTASRARGLPSIGARATFLALVAATAGVPLVVAPPAAHAQSGAASATRIERLMTREEMERTGVARLSAAERAALERWLASYASIVALGARSAGESSGALVTSSSAGEVVGGETAISPVPEGARRDGAERSGITTAGGMTRPNGAPVGAAAAMRTPGAGRALTATTDAPRAREWRLPARESVAFVAEDGSTVRLGDGSLWAVDVAARPAVLAWRLGEGVAVARRPGGSEAEVVIGNPVRGTQAAARLLAVPSPTPGIPATAGRP